MSYNLSLVQSDSIPRPAFVSHKTQNPIQTGLLFTFKKLSWRLIVISKSTQLVLRDAQIHFIRLLVDIISCSPVRRAMLVYRDWLLSVICLRRQTYMAMIQRTKRNAETGEYYTGLRPRERFWFLSAMLLRNHSLENYHVTSRCSNHLFSKQSCYCMVLRCF